jgi:Spy/CpxP family protein refolding chaperone
MIIGLLLVAAMMACDEDQAELTGIEEAGSAVLAGADPGQHLARLQQELDLTDGQLTEIRAIFEEQHAKFQALRESAPEDREAARETFGELREETHARVSAVLTEEQKQRAEELMRSHASHGAWGARDPERHLARLQEKLDLTDSQVAQIRAIFEEQRAKFQALRENAPEDREAVHDAFRVLHEETHERMSKVLTEEQRERVEELMESHTGPRGAWRTWHDEEH